MATARPRSASEPRPDRLTRLLASATERDGSSPDGEGDVWAELLADDERARGEDDARPGGRGRHRSTGPARVVTTPAALRGAQLSVRGTAVVGVLLALVVVVGVVGLRWWLAEQGATPQPLPPHGPGAPVAAAPGAAGATASGAGDAEDTGTSAGGVDAGPSGAAPPPSARPWLVHVGGEVSRPGVVAVPPGARVEEAVGAAGGLTPDADLTRVNLARPVVDGERLWVPAPGEEVPQLADTGASGVGTGPGDGETVGDPPLVDLNTADQAVLEQLPGVGPATARAILDWRDEHGGFSTVEELLEVSGIGEKTLERLRPQVSVG